jgi:hypothetical protein
VDQPPVDNQTDFIVHPQMQLDRDGDKLVAIVKATWELPVGGEEIELAPEHRARLIRPGPAPWGLPGETTDMFPSDVCVRRPGTDVVVVARAYAPGGRPATQWDVSARVGHLNKVLRVFGLRVWEGGGQGISSATAIRELDLRYEYAWGGIDMNDAGHVVEEPHNPAGRGIALDAATLTHKPAPQIEDPFNLITSVLTKPAPAGVGPVMVHWEPRRGHAGTYDDKWLEERAPVPPLDEDDRLHNVATPALHSDTPLVGGEDVALAGMSPGGGGVAFKLPRVGIEITFARDNAEPLVLRPHLDTIVIDQLFGPNRGWPVVEMVWRAAAPAPRRAKYTSLSVRELTP